eukprot:1143257-Pelagomonas_calceolata.AAC.8
MPRTSWRNGGRKPSRRSRRRVTGGGKKKTGGCLFPQGQACVCWMVRLLTKAEQRGGAALDSLA